MRKDWRDRCPQEGGPAAAGGWHPQPGPAGDQGLAGDRGQSVVQLKAVFPHGAGFVLAFEFMLSDLAEVVRHAQRPLTQAQVKSYLQMLLKGVAFCHANNIVHREIKDLPDYKTSFKEQAPVPLEEVLPDASPQALDLLGHFLLYPPRQRIAASQDKPDLLFFCSGLIRPQWSCSWPGSSSRSRGDPRPVLSASHLLLVTDPSEGGSEFRCHACHGAGSLVAAFLVRDSPGRAIWGSAECRMSSCRKSKREGKCGLILFSETLDTSSLLRFIIKTPGSPT
ncbi:cyclin-dependent kinase 20-like [Eschrichtius robustus]|uniref:cyclin-dependent kinase 20-like n=1 Tax=Eschrichtius robustus TaxID=9764 RepID=UPI0035C0F925